MYITRFLELQLHCVRVMMSPRVHHKCECVCMYVPQNMCACRVPRACLCVWQVKQSRVRGGGSAELDAAELQAKEQEAARAAAELLEQLEKEAAAKSASKGAAKKKRKGGQSASCKVCVFALEPLNLA